MRQISVTVPVLLLTFAVAASRTAAADKEEAKTENKLLGTWRCISAKYNGKESKRPPGSAHLKHVTPTQFMWVWYYQDGKVTAGIGGTYTIKGDEYVDFDALKGKPQVFKWRVEGNKWYHTGKLSGGMSIEEVWERVEKK